MRHRERLTSDGIIAAATQAGISVSEIAMFTIGGIMDLETEIMWAKYPEHRVYNAEQSDFDSFANM